MSDLQPAKIPQALVIGSVDANGFELVHVEESTGGVIWRHTLVLETVDDYSQVYEIALDKARRGCCVKILPILNQGDPLRGEVFKGAKENKCPDMNVDGSFIDVKTVEGTLSNANINNNIRKGCRQASHVCIRIPGNVEYWRLRYIAQKRFRAHSDLAIVEYKLIGFESYTFRRRDWLF